jgi:hypothetical protein
MREAVHGALYEPKHLSDAERRREKAIRGTSCEEAFQELFNDGDGEGEGFSQ